jgi:hypothetical protein
MAAPKILPWLISLDNDKGHGHHNMRFFQYSEVLKDKSIYDLMDMEDLTWEELVKMLDCPTGLAK